MTDILIRNVPQSDIDRLDTQASRLGVTRAELLRRRIHEEAVRAEAAVCVQDFTRLGELAHDLTDETLMREAWS